ncbi:ABC transporter substrate-binding protein [Dictyobacter aurantiacus]|uniref:Sugar ABC transporter substrate-binding protein n=1 Tax=Dictyobacter aurantiacus TaxID=1936993 RepID=A0A401ZP93_9CHLR|nr:extracellular solute-binding protein [Dictyobacter aurantiacus]GCE08662.1 sugar ABC transporter substrate-binding protein [Dictyobacter aurantiacus]
MAKGFKQGFFILCLLFVLTACRGPAFLPGSGTNSDGRITMTLWYWNRALDDRLLAQVERRFPHVRFQVLKIGGGYDAKLRTSLAGHANIPDIVAINANIATYFPDADQFADLRLLGAGRISQAYLDWKWQQGIAPGGRVIALPMDTGPTALFYRADLFKRAGLPSDPVAVAARLKTWDDYLQAGVRMRQATGGRVHMFDNINNVFTQIMGQSRQQYFDAANHYIGDRAEVRRAWNYAARVHQLDLSAKATSYSTDWSAAISTSSIASFVGAVWMKHRLKDAGPETAGLWRVVPAPGGPGSAGGSFLAVTAASPHPQLAFAIASWLMSAHNQLTAYLDTGLYPSTRASLDSPQLQRPEAFFGGQVTTKIFSQVAANIQPVPNSPDADVVQNVLQRELTLIEMQNMNAQTAWSVAQQQIQRELSH